MYNSNKLNVLVVEDEDAFRMALKEVLTGDGEYDVIACESGEQAVDILQRQHVDVVLLDYKMPGMSGLNVLQWMHEQKMETPVLMVTAAGSEHVAVEAMKLGAYDYLRKEQLDVDHIGIMINGVHERYLYKKEKERRQRIEIERSKSLVAIESFHSTLASLSQIVNNSLSIISANIETKEMEVLPRVPAETRGILQNVFAEMRQQYGILSFAMKSMFNMANMLHGNFTQSTPVSPSAKKSEQTRDAEQIPVFQSGEQK